MEPNNARPVIHPASFSGMREKIITVGAAFYVEVNTFVRQYANSSDVDGRAKPLSHPASDLLVILMVRCLNWNY